MSASTEHELEIEPELDPDPPPGRDLPPGPLTAALVIGGGFLIGGPFGLAVAVLALLVWRRQPDWLGALVAGLLALAALGSVVGAWPGPDSLRQSYADDRPWAAAAGLGAGVALLVAVARAARSDRALTGPSVAGPTRVETAPAVRRIEPWLVPAATLSVAAGVSLLFAPESLPPDVLAAAEALRAGEGFVLDPGGAPSVSHPPAALVVAAVFPSSPALLLAVVTAVTVGATMVLGTRLAGRRVGLIAGGVAALLPLVWDQQLPGALAGLASVAALLLAWPDRLTVPRGVAAGVLAVGAVLARPEAILVVAVSLAWPWVWPDRQARRRARAGWIALLVTTLSGLGMSSVQLHAATGSWVPGGALWPAAGGAGLAAILPLLLDVTVVGLALDEVRARRDAMIRSWGRHLPWVALPALAVGLFVVTLGDRSLWFAIAPPLAVAAAARLSRLLPAAGHDAVRAGR